MSKHTVYFSNVECEAIRDRITLKLGSLLSVMIRNAFPKKTSACVGKNPDRGRATSTIFTYPLRLNISFFGRFLNNEIQQQLSRKFLDDSELQKKILLLPD